MKAIVLLSALVSGAALAQSAGLCCTLQAVAGTSRYGLACPGGVRITAEAGARYMLTDRNQDGTADGVVLRSKALLVEVPAAEVPIGVLTATIGAPFFLFLLLRQRAILGL